LPGRDFGLAMNEKANPGISQRDVQKLSPAAKAFAGLLIGLCFVVAAAWVYFLGRAFWTLLQWIFN
jgi:hypothetical protein